MIGTIKNGEKLPYISLDSFINTDLLEDALSELEEYRLKQNEEGYEKFISYNKSDWGTDNFQKKQRESLPKTFNYISSFSKQITPYNILWSNYDNNIVLLHRDNNPNSMPTAPWNSLEDGYKLKLKDSYYSLLKNPDNFKITSKFEEVNKNFNGIDFDYEGFLKEKYKKDYNNFIKNSYKLHLVLSPTKSLFIYDNTKDKIHPINTKACLFNSMDFHDTYLNSWGYSIQFTMNPHFLKDEIKDYCEIK